MHKICKHKNRPPWKNYSEMIFDKIKLFLSFLKGKKRIY